jgi:hypothetical protein
MQHSIAADISTPWQLIAGFLGVIAVIVMLLTLVATPLAVVPGAQGLLAYEAAATRFGNRSAHRILSLEPESPLRAAGIEAGDLLIAPPRGMLAAGQRLELEVVHAGSTRTVTVTAPAIERLATPLQNALDIMLELLAGFLGLLVALRRPRDLGALMFACCFLLAVGGIYPGLFPAGRIAAFLDAWSSTCGVMALPLTAYFALNFEGGYVSAARRWLIGACASLGAMGLLWALITGPYFLGHAWLEPAVWLTRVRSGLVGSGVLLCALTFLDVWRHSPPERRPRLRWLFCGVGIALLTFVLLSGYFLGLWGYGPAALITVSICADAFTATGMLVLAYAILRHRVVDVGFVINRALVYGILTAGLLVSFGLIEWLVDHFVRFEQRERSQLLDAIIALGLFLLFHRARHWIENLVERVFFGAWHAREAQLARFLDKAPHFSSAATLAESLLAAVDAYAGAHSGLYLRETDGRFALRAATLAGLPPELEADAAALIEMKTFKVPLLLGPAPAPTLGEAALAVPMLRRAELVGALVLAAARPGESYRPDQLESLAHAAQQVCLDLYALRLEQVEARVRALEAHSSASGRLLDELGAPR